MNQNYTETPTEQDFPLIDHCVICERICDWQPRYEIAVREYDHTLHLKEQRPLEFTPETRVIKICADCTPVENSALRMLIRKHYTVYAKRKGI